ncbi:MAG: response regulator [Candidatus Binatia bacterium]
MLGNFVTRDKGISPAGSAPRILIVESSQNHLKALYANLDGLSYSPQIQSENDGQTALERAKHEALDLFIIDAYLRGKVDGFELCRAVRSSPAGKHIPIILVLSGYLSLERLKAIAAGADLLLYRPIIKGELIRLTELLLALKYAQAEPTPAPRITTRRDFQSVL